MCGAVSSGGGSRPVQGGRRQLVVDGGRAREGVRKRGGIGERHAERAGEKW